MVQDLMIELSDVIGMLGLLKEDSMEEAKLADRYYTIKLYKKHHFKYTFEIISLLTSTFNIFCKIKLMLQVRDEYRTDYDGGRGGYGKIIAQKITPTPMER